MKNELIKKEILFKSQNNFQAERQIPLVIFSTVRFVKKCTSLCVFKTKCKSATTEKLHSHLHLDIVQKIRIK